MPMLLGFVVMSMSAEPNSRDAVSAGTSRSVTIPSVTCGARSSPGSDLTATPASSWPNSRALS